MTRAVISQLHGLADAILLAKITGRVLVLPPLQPHYTAVKSGNFMSEAPQKFVDVRSICRMVPVIPQARWLAMLPRVTCPPANHTGAVWPQLPSPGPGGPHSGLGVDALVTMVSPGEGRCSLGGNGRQWNRIVCNGRKVVGTHATMIVQGKLGLVGVLCTRQVVAHPAWKSEFTIGAAVDVEREVADNLPPQHRKHAVYDSECVRTRRGRLLCSHGLAAQTRTG